MSTTYNNGSHYKVEDTFNPKELISKCQTIQTSINSMRRQADQVDNLISTILPALQQMDSQMTAQQQQIQQQQQEITKLKQQITQQIRHPPQNDQLRQDTPPKHVMQSVKSLLQIGSDKKAIILSEQSITPVKHKQLYQSSITKEQFKNSRLETETKELLFNCTSCQQQMYSYVQLNCQHMYHETCLLSTINQQTSVKKQSYLNCLCGTHISTNVVRNLQQRYEAGQTLEQLFKNQIASLINQYPSIKQCQQIGCSDLFFQGNNPSPFCSLACEYQQTYSRNNYKSMIPLTNKIPIKVINRYGA